MINFDFSKDCCGCGACADTCALGCISIIKDKKDFRIPNVETSKCVECGKCEKVCPVINPSSRVNDEQKLYCTYNNKEDIREKGSSGSIFYEVAKIVISDGGVVYGAAFVDKLQLKHCKAETIEDVFPIMKSKYIQSNTNGVFKDVRNELKKGRKVLFVGTPCHCQALYNFLGRKEQENLILIDFICHGVPPQELFDHAIELYEKQHDCIVKDFSFRHKTQMSLHNYKISYTCNDGTTKTETGSSDEFPFYCGYLKYITFRNSCYGCKFCNQNRITDMTLGDFWHLENIDPTVQDFNKGYSMLIVNSAKGHEIFNLISGELQYKEYNIDIAEPNNHAYCKPTFRSIKQKLYIRDYNRIPYEKLSERYFSYQLSLPRRIIRRIIYEIERRMQ